ncbi:MAG: hypothetical protein GY864_04895 [Desulfobacterales bacterium]|nr:hypothetical protein [Desulfobacterales bacterium]
MLKSFLPKFLEKKGACLKGHGADLAIPQGMIADSMLQSGFKSVRSFTQQSDFGDMDIDIGRK